MHLRLSRPPRLHQVNLLETLEKVALLQNLAQLKIVKVKPQLLGAVAVASDLDHEPQAARKVARVEVLHIDRPSRGQRARGPPRQVLDVPPLPAGPFLVQVDVDAAVCVGDGRAYPLF